MSIALLCISVNLCGVLVMKFNIQVNDAGVIIDSKFKTFGCGSAIASSSLASEWVKGKHIDEATLITNKEIAGFLKLPPVKLHCSMLAQDAIQSAIRDYSKKLIWASVQWQKYNNLGAQIHLKWLRICSFRNK